MNSDKYLSSLDMAFDISRSLRSLLNGTRLISKDGGQKLVEESAAEWMLRKEMIKRRNMIEDSVRVEAPSLFQQVIKSVYELTTHVEHEYT